VKKSSTDVVLTPVVDALIVVIMLVFMALLVYAGNRAPIIEILRPHEARIKQNGLGMSVLKITDPDGDSLSIKISRLYNFIDTTYSNDTLILSIKPLKTTEKKLYDFTVSASDNNDHTTKHRIMFEVIGEGQKGNNPPVINTITSWPKVIVQEKVEYAKLEIYDPDGDEINIDTSDLPDFIESEFNDGILTLAFKPTKNTEQELHDYWLRVKDDQNAYDSLWLIFMIKDNKKSRDPICGIKDSFYSRISIHALNKDEIIAEYTPTRNGRNISMVILNKKYKYGDFIGKFMDVRGLSKWSKLISEHGKSGKFGDVGICTFQAYIHLYDEDKDLFNQLEKIGSNNYFFKINYETPLLDNSDCNNIKCLKKEIKKKIRWN